MKRMVIPVLLALLFSSAALANTDGLCGKYRGLVTDDNDPVLQGRLKVDVPPVFGGLGQWAMPNVPFGKVRLPAIGDLVWVSFEGCDPSMPIWEGSPVVHCKLDKNGNVSGCQAP